MLVGIQFRCNFDNHAAFDFSDMAIFEKDIGVFAFKEFSDRAAKRNGLLQEPFWSKAGGCITTGKPVRFTCILGESLAAGVKVIGLSFVAC